MNTSEVDDHDVEHYYKMARLAVDKAKLFVVNGTSANPPPRVGFVFEKNGSLLGWAAKGVEGEYLLNGAFCPFPISASEHAEQALLARFGDVDLAGASVYVTLEPCTKRKKGTSCAELLIAKGVTSVHVGNCDPNPDVASLAWRKFHEHNVLVKDFPGNLRNEAKRDNAAFFDKFPWSRKMSGSAAFGYEADGGTRSLGPAGQAFETRWTSRDCNSVYALDYTHNVCIAKHCVTFDQVDDPGRWMEDSHYTKPGNVGEIVVFRNEYGFALVKILSVTLPREESNAELHFKYQLRYN